jgi:hypothetical protein
VKYEPPVFINDGKARGAQVHNFTKLALLLGNLHLLLDQGRNVIRPSHALTAYEADMATAVGNLNL